MLFGETPDWMGLMFLNHVMARGIERWPVFIDDREKDKFVRRLSETRGLPVSTD
jgi:hypothetical protein